MSGDLAAWLRAEIQADLDAARIIGAGGFEPQRWDTEPPGQVNPVTVPYRVALTAVLLPDAEDRRDRESLPRWVEVVGYDRMLTEPPEADCRNDDLPVMLVDNGRREVEHVIRNDPRNVVARCEAEMAILDEHAPADWKVHGDRVCRRCAWDEDAAGPDDWLTFPCRTVRLLASGYRHHPGYREEWKP